METKEVKLKASKPTDDIVISINANETTGLIQVLNGLKMANRTLPPSAVKFVLKNLKKLQALWDKLVAEDNEFRKTFPKIEEFTELHEPTGNAIFSNGGKPEGEELKPTEVTLVKAYFDRESKKLIDTTTNEPVTDGETLRKMSAVYLSDEKKSEYELATKDYHVAQNEIREKKHDCHVVTIGYKFLEENKISIPMQIPNPSIGEVIYLDSEMFYTNLVPDWEK